MAEENKKCSTCSDQLEGRTVKAYPIGKRLPGKFNVFPFKPPTADELEITHAYYTVMKVDTERNSDVGIHSRVPTAAPILRSEVRRRLNTGEVVSLFDASAVSVNPDGPAAMSKQVAPPSAEQPQNMMVPERIRHVLSGEDVLMASQITAPWLESASTPTPKLPGFHIWPHLLRLLLVQYGAEYEVGPTMPLLPGFHIIPGLLRALIEYFFPSAEWDSGRRVPDPADWRSQPPVKEDCDVFGQAYVIQLWVPLGAKFIKTVKGRTVFVPDHKIEDNKPATAMTSEGTTAHIIEAELNRHLKAGDDSPDQAAEVEADETRGAANEWLGRTGRVPSAVLEGLKGRSPWDQLVNSIREALRRWPGITLKEDPCSDENCIAPEVCFGQILMNYFRVIELRWQWNVLDVRRTKNGMDGGRPVVVVDFDLYVRWWARVETEFLFKCVCVDPQQDPATPPEGDGTGTEPADDPDLPGPNPVPGPGEEPGNEPGKPGPLPGPPTFGANSALAGLGL